MAHGLETRPKSFVLELCRFRFILFWVIDTAQDLEQFLETLKSASWVAVDTEADSLHAYPEKICLIQISTASGDRIVDPLAGFGIGSLLSALAQHDLIMHGSDYDLRLFRKHHQFVPKAIFDTMLAARLLGITQFSLSNLVEKFLQVKLEKGPQKANWAMRPLTPRMEAYARNDTRFLKPLSDQLRAELQAKGRLEWHSESCARLVKDCARVPEADPDQIWRIKGSHRLSRPALAVLRELYHWRDREALRANKPPYFILSHELLVHLAVQHTSGGAIDPLLPRSMSDRRRGALHKALEDGKALPADRHPHIPRTIGHRPTEAERRRFAELQARRDVQATRLGIDPTLIASRAELSSLATDWDKNAPTLMKWQRQLFEAA